MARVPHIVNPGRTLRSGAWLLQRSWRHPHRSPAGWRSERFAFAVDLAREQLRPIRSLHALADSFARESHHLVAGDRRRVGRSGRSRFGDSALEVAYVTRFIEIHAGRELRDWRQLCRRADH